ncbi:MAG: Gfo/Idh/MocA family oxidoreductase [Candidatus Omnitrophica bacterium]|nr:Gfo/Idh/MocA family oxidoreductase [Candidatus Omnitrophota bacterium]
MGKIKILQVGTGNFGKSWIEIIKKSPEWELAGIVDINRETLQSVAHEYNIPEEKCFTSIEEAIKKTDPSALMNATPPQFHKNVSLLAFDAGLNVIVEKPLSNNIRDAQDMVSYAEKKGKKLMVSQNYRYRNQPRTIRNVIENGIIGRIGYATINFQKGPHFGGFREEMEYPLLIDMAIHHFDLMRYITGENPVSLYAKSWNPYWSWFKRDASVNLSIEFNNNIQVSYSGSWVSTGRETSWDGDWEIYGEKGSIVWKNGRIYFISNGKTEEIEPIKMEREDRYLSLYEFYCALKENREPETSGKDNLYSLSMVFTSIESAKNGIPVSIRLF